MPTPRERDYVLGTHDEEIVRLGIQHRVWRPRSLDAWRRAGFTVGQTIVDVGCGPGYATLDLADIVGASGKVIAIDRSRRFLDVVESTRDRLGLDNVETYAQPTRVTGWHVSAHTQLIFNTALAKMAHSNGLSVGLKNDLGQVPRLEPKFDFAINEQCFQYHECTNNPSPGYKAFLRDGKPVFQVEYRRSPRRFCALANAANFNSIKKSGNFRLRDRKWKPCR